MQNLVPIGRFSQMTRLSIKALRLYDEQGLLAPAWVDPASGYRYYRPGQANKAEAIRILRMIDMPLDEIADVLATDDPELVTKRLTMHRERLQHRLADQERMLRFLERLIEREEGVMPYDITVKKVTAQSVVSVTRHTNLAQVGQVIAQGFAALIAAMTTAGTEGTGAPFIIFHDIIDEQTEGNIELCVPVPAGTGQPGPDVDWKEIPGGSVASTVHHGPYLEVSSAYHTLAGWIQEHGHQMAAAPREIYLNDPQQVGPEDLLTEVQWPIEDAE